MSLFPKFKVNMDPVATPATSATQSPKSSKSSESSRPPKSEINFWQLYHQTAEAVRKDCFLIDPAWLLDHPAFYEQIRILDDTLTVMEREGAGKLEYQATLAKLVICVQETRKLYEREQASEAAMQ